MSTEAPNHVSDVPTRDVISILEEAIHVEKRLVESGHASVRVNVSEHDETVETLLKHQAISVERVPMNIQVAAPPPTRQSGDTVIVSIVEERVVVEKRLFVTEELHIRIDQTPHLDRQVVRLRREHAEITEDGTNLPERNPT